MSMYSLVFYVPVAAAEAVKEAVFAAGAGKIGEYEACCWQVEGQGQFRPSQQANPTIGNRGELTHVPEFRVEMVCEKQHLAAALAALRQAHPYEEPAYHYFAINAEG